MWVLQLNPMPSNAEVVTPVGYAETREKLEAYLAAETVEPYQDGQWSKAFRKGGPLEWYNPPLGGEAFINIPAMVDIGTQEDWAHQASERYQNFLNGISYFGY